MLNSHRYRHTRAHVHTQKQKYAQKYTYTHSLMHTIHFPNHSISPTYFVTNLVVLFFLYFLPFIFSKVFFCITFECFLVQQKKNKTIHKNIHTIFVGTYGQSQFILYNSQLIFSLHNLLLSPPPQPPQPPKVNENLPILCQFNLLNTRHLYDSSSVLIHFMYISLLQLLCVNR